MRCGFTGYLVSIYGEEKIIEIMWIYGEIMWVYEAYCRVTKKVRVTVV